MYSQVEDEDMEDEDAEDEDDDGAVEGCRVREYMEMAKTIRKPCI